MADGKVADPPQASPAMGGAKAILATVTNRQAMEATVRGLGINGHDGHRRGGQSDGRLAGSPAQTRLGQGAGIPARRSTLRTPCGSSREMLSIPRTKSIRWIRRAPGGCRRLPRTTAPKRRWSARANANGSRMQGTGDGDNAATSTGDICPSSAYERSLCISVHCAEEATGTYLAPGILTRLVDIEVVTHVLEPGNL